jgi:hypothetical protein
MQKAQITLKLYSMQIKNITLAILSGFLFFSSCEDDSSAFKASMYSSMAVESRSYQIYTETGLSTKISLADSNFFSSILAEVPTFDSVKFTSDNEAVLYNRLFSVDPIDTIYNSYTFNFESANRQISFSMPPVDSLLVFNPQNAKGYSVLLSGINDSLLDSYGKRTLNVTNNELFMDLYRVYFKNGDNVFVTSQPAIDTSMFSKIASGSKVYVMKYRQYFLKEY